MVSCLDFWLRKLSEVYLAHACGEFEVYVCAGQRFSYRSGRANVGADGLYQHERGEGATGRILGCEHAFVGATPTGSSTFCTAI